MRNSAPLPARPPRAFAEREEMELRVERLDFNAVGLAFCRGVTVRIPFALPGELVRLRVWKELDGEAFADLLEVVEPAPERAAPACALFGACGGCQLQHWPYERQLEWKRSVIAELFAALPGEPHAVNPVHPSPRPIGYRSKITPHFNRPREGGMPEIGFLRQGTRHAVLDVEHCPIAMEGVNAALPALRASVAARAAEYRRGATLLLREAGGTVTTDPNAMVTETVGNLRLTFPAREFFQNNPFILPEFAGFAVSGAARPGVRFLVDTYCGSGLFALMAAARFEEVLGIELSRDSVRLAEANAAANGIRNCRFGQGDAADLFAQVSFDPGQTAVIMDPPRKGSSPEFLAQLARFAPAVVVYVACGPEAQARDARALLEAGYRLEELQPFDLFPQTRHIENVAVFVRIGSGA